MKEVTSRWWFILACGVVKWSHHSLQESNLLASCSSSTWWVTFSIQLVTKKCEVLNKAARGSPFLPNGN